MMTNTAIHSNSVAAVPSATVPMPTRPCTPIVAAAAAIINATDANNTAMHSNCSSNAAVVNVADANTPSNRPRASPKRLYVRRRAAKAEAATNFHCWPNTASLNTVTTKATITTAKTLTGAQLSTMIASFFHASSIRATQDNFNQTSSRPSPKVF
jgi:hypothetical protein